MEGSLSDLSTLSHVETTSVYAVLLLLSRLYPSLHDLTESLDKNEKADDKNEKQKTLSIMSSSPFVPLIQKCARLPNFLVRRIYIIIIISLSMS